MMRYLPAFGFFAFILLLAAMLTLRHAPESDAVKHLPDLDILALDGKTRWDLERVAVPVRVINVFASWCAPCAAEMPELEKLKKQFPRSELHGIAWNDEPSVLKGWLKKHGNPFERVWVDKKGDATIALGIKGVPETIIADGHGIIRYRLAGPMTAPVRIKTIAPLIEKLEAEYCTDNDLYKDKSCED